MTIAHTNRQTGTYRILDATIIAADIASDAVTTAKILDANVTNAKLATSNHEMAVVAAKTTVAINQTDIEIFEYTAHQALTLVDVQVYCTATAATATVDVKEAGTTVLTAVATPVAGAVVKPAITDSAIASGAAVTVHVTTNGTGTITDLAITLRFKYALIA